jgi:hypothetical protein
LKIKDKEDAIIKLVQELKSERFRANITALESAFIPAEKYLQEIKSATLSDRRDLGHQTKTEDKSV